VVLVVALPLTRATRGLIGERELSLMKPDAILVDVARAATVERTRCTSTCAAILRSRWASTRGGRSRTGQGSFVTRRPFLDVPNVPEVSAHSAITAHSLQAAAARPGCHPLISAP
jgi:hypothetical protein